MRENAKYLIIEPVYSSKPKAFWGRRHWFWGFATLGGIGLVAGWVWQPPQNELNSIHWPGVATSIGLAFMLGFLLGALLRLFPQPALFLVVGGVLSGIIAGYAGLIEINQATLAQAMEALPSWFVPPDGGWRGWLASRFLLSLLAGLGLAMGAWR